MQRARWLLPALVLLGAARGTSRADSPARVAVLPFEGPRAAVARAEVVRLVRRQRGVQLVAVPARSATADRGALARRHRLEAIVSGRTRASGARVTVTIAVWRASDQAVVGEISIGGPARSLAALVRGQAARELPPLLRAALEPAPAAEPPVQAAAPAAPPAPTPEMGERAGPDDAPDPVRARPPDGRRPRTLEVVLGLRVSNRLFRYLNPGTVLPGFRLTWAPAPVFHGEIYPLGWLAAGPLAHLGLTASAEHTVPTSSRWRTEDSYPTRAWGWSAGAKARVPLGPVEPFGAAAYGAEGFRLLDAPSGAPRPSVPDVAYRYVRAGAGARIALGSGLSFAAAAAFLHLLSSGELASEGFFPDAEGRGVEGSAAVGIPIGSSLQLRIAGDFRQYDFTLNAAPDGLRIAEAAVDRYLGVMVALATFVPHRR